MSLTSYLAAPSRDYKNVICNETFEVLLTCLLADQVGFGRKLCEKFYDGKIFLLELFKSFNFGIFHDSFKGFSKVNSHGFDWPFELEWEPDPLR